jgi:hypothetical protein
MWWSSLRKAHVVVLCSARSRKRKREVQARGAAGNSQRRASWESALAWLARSLCLSLSFSVLLCQLQSLGLALSFYVSHSVLLCLSLGLALRCLSMSATRSCFVFLCLDVKPHTLHAKLSAHMRTHAGMRA